jgi:hypothetical protein
LKQKKGKAKKDQYVWEIKPDPSIGPTGEKTPTKTLAPGAENVPLNIVNHRKAQSWKVELLADFTNGERAFSKIIYCYQHIPDKTQQYLKQHNLIQDHVKEKWRNIGFRNDPKKPSKSSCHDYDEWCEKLETKAAIKKEIEKYKTTGKKK